MIPVGLAVLLGLMAAPVALVFGPAYFPWSLLVLASFGGLVGLSITPHRQRLLRAAGLAALMTAVIVGALMLTSQIAPSPSPAALRSELVWIGSLLLTVLVGVLTGTTLRTRLGLGRGAGIGVALMFAVALVGAGLAFAFAPSEVGNAPRCADNLECPRTWCAQMAERTRLLALERVVAFDDNRITCTYTAWGGVYVGRADVGSPGGGSWTDGAWPKILLGR